MMVHKYGVEFEETKSIILLNKIIEVITGKKSKKLDKDIPETPDIKKFKLRYGSIIKTPKDRKEN